MSPLTQASCARTPVTPGGRLRNEAATPTGNQEPDPAAVLGSRGPSPQHCPRRPAPATQGGALTNWDRHGTKCLLGPSRPSIKTFVVAVSGSFPVQGSKTRPGHVERVHATDAGATCCGHCEVTCPCPPRTKRVPTPPFACPDHASPPPRGRPHCPRSLLPQRARPSSPSDRTQLFPTRRRPSLAFRYFQIFRFCIFLRILQPFLNHTGPPWGVLHQSWESLE